MVLIYTWFLLNKDQLEAFNSAIRGSSLPTNTFDALTVKLWEVIVDPLVDPHTWLWGKWLLNEAETAEFIVILESRGPVNTTSPAGKGAYFQDNEPQTGASLTTAPIGGWTNGGILSEITFRKRLGYQVLNS